MGESIYQKKEKYKTNSSLFISLLIISLFTGCSLDDRYHYTFAYRIENQTDLYLSGSVLFDSTRYSNPSSAFGLGQGETI